MHPRLEFFTQWELPKSMYLNKKRENWKEKTPIYLHKLGSERDIVQDYQKET